MTAALAGAVAAALVIAAGVHHYARPRIPEGRGAAATIVPPAVSSPARGDAIRPDGHEGTQTRVPVAERLPPRLPAEGTPSGWEVKEFVGRPDVELVRNEGTLALRLRSERTSYALYRDVVVDPREQPYLTWTWKVTTLPTGGDVRAAATDDQAAQVYVVFPRWPSPQTNSDVIGYVWDTSTPAETRLASPKAPNVRIVVVESGAAALGGWRRYRRNVLEDYVAFFGRQPPRIGKVAIMIDTADTRSRAEAFIGQLVFETGHVENKESPTPMLR